MSKGGDFFVWRLLLVICSGLTGEQVVMKVLIKLTLVLFSGMQ